MVIFFGYANCESICSVALPRMGAAPSTCSGVERRRSRQS
jgi:cytochrome oxidase Cu insertion factor (SCO1/SenC/PrrC family)